MNPTQIVVLGVTTLILVISVVGSLWHVLIHLVNLTIQEYEPVDDRHVRSLAGDITLMRSYTGGACKTRKLQYMYFRHLYWLVRDVQTGKKVAVLVNCKKKQFKSGRDDFEVGDEVKITGGYLKRRFDNDAAVQTFEDADPVTESIPEKTPSRWLRFLGITSPYNRYLHPLGLGLDEESVEKKQPIGVMLVAQLIEPVSVQSNQRQVL